MAGDGNDAPPGFRRFSSDDPRFPITFVYPERYSRWYDSNSTDHLYVDFHGSADFGFFVMRRSRQRAQAQEAEQGSYSFSRPGDDGVWTVTRQSLTDAEFKTVVESIRWLD